LFNAGPAGEAAQAGFARSDAEKTAACFGVFVHTAHHRAQCEVYMRVKGIKPPSYTF